MGQSQSPSTSAKQWQNLFTTIWTQGNVRRVREESTGNRFLMLSLPTSASHDQYQQLIKHRAPSRRFITNLAFHKKGMISKYCGNQFRHQLLFDDCSPTLEDYLIYRRTNNKRFEYQQIEYVIRSGLLGLKDVRDMGQEHGYVNLRSICVGKQVTLKDPIIVAEEKKIKPNDKDKTIDGFPSSKKLYTYFDTLTNFKQHYQDLFSLGLVALQLYFPKQNVSEIYTHKNASYLNTSINTEMLRTYINQVKQPSIRQKVQILLNENSNQRSKVYNLLRADNFYRRERVFQENPFMIASEDHPQVNGHQTQFTSIQPENRGNNFNRQNSQRFVDRPSRIGKQEHQITVQHSHSRGSTPNQRSPNTIQPGQIRRQKSGSAPKITFVPAQARPPGRLPPKIDMPPPPFTEPQGKVIPSWRNSQGVMVYSPPKPLPYGNIANSVTTKIQRPVSPEPLQTKNRLSRKDSLDNNRANPQINGQQGRPPLIGMPNGRNSREISPNGRGIENMPLLTNIQRETQQNPKFQLMSDSQAKRRASPNQPAGNPQSSSMQKYSPKYIQNMYKNVHGFNQQLVYPPPAVPQQQTIANTLTGSNQKNVFRPNSEDLSVLNSGNQVAVSQQVTNKQQNTTVSNLENGFVRSPSEAMYQKIENNRKKVQERFSLNIDTHTSPTNALADKTSPNSVTSFVEKFEQLTSSKKRQGGKSSQDRSMSSEPQGSQADGYVIEQYQIGTKYQGYKKNGMRNGQGEFVYKQGSKYRGEWKDNKMQGYGTLYYPNGQVAYQGQWKNDQFDGKGVVYNDSPSLLKRAFDYTNFGGLDQEWISYQGELSKDSKEGTGILLLTNGEVYQGDFKNDMVDGQGMFKRINGTIIRGRWQEGKLKKIYQG